MGRVGKGRGVLWENERAICQHGNTSKSHRNARSPCLTGRIKPRCECVRAPCITRWAYSISLIRTLWKTEHRLIATVAVNNSVIYCMWLLCYKCATVLLRLLCDDYGFSDAFNAEGWCACRIWVGHSDCVCACACLCAVLWVAGTLSHTEVGGRMMKRMHVKILFHLH